MLGKLVAALLLMIGVGVLLQLTTIVPLAAIGAFLMMTAGAVIGLALVVALVYAFEAILFRTTNRWDRFN